MDYDISKHLDLIQTIIGRMANNSFLLKGWSITLVAALFALAAKDSNTIFALLALFPALSFWGLDAYYLRQERLFRCLYKDVCQSFSSGEKPLVPFSIDTSEYKLHVRGWFKTLWSKTILAVHGVVMLLIAAVLLVTRIF